MNNKENENGLPRISEATLSITLQCPVGCSFCYRQSSPTKKEAMNKRQALKTIDELFEARLGIEHINISGGEPFLKPGVLRAVVDKTTSLTIISSVTTSAFWAKTYKTAVDVLTDLRERGLWCIAVSVDSASKSSTAAVRRERDPGSAK